MKALVLGGSRFFGKRLVKLLLDQEVEVTVLNRGLTPDDFGKHVRRIQMDRRDLRANHPLIKGLSWDIVYDQICYDAKEARGACESFADKTKRYIFTSSKSVYGPGSLIPESVFDPKAYKFTKDIYTKSSYAEAKRQAEAVFFQKANFPVVAVRFPIVLGPDDYTRRLHFHVERVLQAQPIYFPNLDAKITFVEADDAARFLAGLSENDFEGQINCCSLDAVTLRQVMSWIEVETGRAAKLVSKKEDGEASPFGIEENWYMNTSKLQQLGFRPKEISKWFPSLVRELVPEILNGGKNKK